MLGAQNGHVFAVDALSGALMWKSPKLGTMLQAAPTVVLSGWGGGADLVFVGTRESGQPNRFVALNANDGTVAWVFDNGGGANGIGMIVGNATVDYAARRVYFTSALGASSKTTWCLDYTVTPPANCWATPGVSPIGGGDIEAAPILHQGSLLVSDTAPGDLYAVDPMTGLDAIFFPLGNGGAKGFVFPQLGTLNVFASTSFETMSVRFGVPNWTESCVATPSTPIAVPGTDWVFVGSNEGKLFQHSASTGGGCSSSACVGNCVDTVVGAPAYDVLKTLLYVGTDDGIIHAVRPPF
jgi:outer membrane protein assembly factor BamB